MSTVPLSDKEAFLQRLQEKLKRLAAPHSRFEVFELSQSGLLQCIEAVGFSSFAGEDYVIMHQIQKAIEPLTTERACWARVCLDLWYCRNFHALHWGELVQHKPENVRYAIQAAYYVWASSGSDSAHALGRFLAGSAGGSIARPYLEGLRRDPYSSKWVDRVLARK
jgi:hypothetical protein